MCFFVFFFFSAARAGRLRIDHRPASASPAGARAFTAAEPGLPGARRDRFRASSPPRSYLVRLAARRRRRSDEQSHLLPWCGGLQGRTSTRSAALADLHQVVDLRPGLPCAVLWTNLCRSLAVELGRGPRGFCGCGFFSFPAGYHAVGRLPALQAWVWRSSTIFLPILRPDGELCWIYHFGLLDRPATGLAIAGLRLGDNPGAGLAEAFGDLARDA